MLFVDLDGTVVDDRRRHHAAYVATLERSDVKGVPIPEREYWFWKQNQGRVDDLIRRSRVFPTKHELYRERFEQLLESPDYLELDVLRPGTETFLSRVYTKTPIVLVTQRRNGSALEEQLDELGIRKYFVTVLHGAPDRAALRRGPASKARGIHKADLVRARYKIPPSESVWIGDTETDREAARSLGYRSILLEGGHRAKPKLVKAAPDRVVSDLSETLSELLPGGRWQR